MRLLNYFTRLLRTLDIKRIILETGIVVLLFGVGFSVRPAYRAYRSYQVDRNLAAARMAALHGDWSTAREKARSVLMDRSKDFDAFRIWARACGKLGEPRAYIAAAQFFSDPRANRDDLLELYSVIWVRSHLARVVGGW
ncbi:MAG: hypothetical protein WCJ66_15065, partial [Verrucomicrobiota bacterium]